MQGGLYGTQKVLFVLLLHLAFNLIWSEHLKMAFLQDFNLFLYLEYLYHAFVTYGTQFNLTAIFFFLNQ